MVDYFLVWKIVLIKPEGKRNLLNCDSSSSCVEIFKQIAISKIFRFMSYLMDILTVEENVSRGVSSMASINQIHPRKCPSLVYPSAVKCAMSETYLNYRYLLIYKCSNTRLVIAWSNLIFIINLLGYNFQCCSHGFSLVTLKFQQELCSLNLSMESKTC